MHCTDLCRTHAICTDCEERSITESEMWMDRSGSQHPLAQYKTLMRSSRSRTFEQPKWLVHILPDILISTSISVTSSLLFG